VVFCPCAFTLATPTAIAAGIGNAAHRGMLIKSGAALENLAKVDTVFFDKTGTLTMGEIEVKTLRAADGVDELELLCLAASAEMFSEHPIARAVLKYADGKVKPEEPSKTVSLTGVGVEAQCAAGLVRVEKFSGDAESEFLRASFGRGESVVCVSLDGRPLGVITLADTVRADAREAVQKLEEFGYSCAMLSGDNIRSARSIAEQAGIEDVRAPLMPEDKLRMVKEAQDAGRKVCMIGDGVNDAPALALADSSVAMADLESDLAIDAAQVSLIGGDLRKIPVLLRFSRKVLGTIKTNIGMSFAINFSAVLLSVYGLLTPVSGALLHNVSSVIVVLNSAMLLRRK